MSVAGFALSRPYTVIAAILLVCLLAVGAILRMPMDIFPGNQHSRSSASCGPTTA